MAALTLYWPLVYFIMSASNQAEMHPVVHQKGDLSSRTIALF